MTAFEDSSEEDEDDDDVSEDVSEALDEGDSDLARRSNSSVSLEGLNISSLASVPLSHDEGVEGVEQVLCHSSSESSRVLPVPVSANCYA